MSIRFTSMIEKVADVLGGTPSADEIERLRQQVCLVVMSVAG